LKYIDKLVFDGATGLQNVYIADVAAWCGIDFETIASNPLSYGGVKLYVNGVATTDIVISDEVKEIKNYAFYNFSNMTSLVIGKNVEKIGVNAFAGCRNLVKVEFNATNCADLTLNTEAFIYAGHAVKASETNMLGGVELIIGESVTAIPAYLFASESGIYPAEYQTPNLVKVSFAQGSVCTEIGKAAFYDCSELQEVTFGYVNEDGTFVSTIKLVDDEAFMYCLKLQSAVFGDSIKTIGANAFLGCESLSHIEIPDTILKIDDEAFAGCYAVEKVVYPAFAVKYIDVYALKDVTITSGEIADSAYNSSDIKKLTIGAGVTKIGELAFAYSPIETLDLSVATAVIGAYAFNECDELENLVIGDAITTIEEGAFYYCKALTDVKIGANVETIGQWAFYDCLRLKTARIGGNVTAIGAEAFSGTILETVDFIDRIGWTVSCENAQGVQEQYDIISTELADSKNAAKFLKDKYAHCDWTKND
jgi:hypothetical protein